MKLRNISDYKNKSKEDLIKAFSEPKGEPKPQTPKPKSEETPKPEPEPGIEIKVNTKSLKKLKKDFHKLRHKFSKEEIDRYRKVFDIAKNYKHLSKSKIKKEKELLSESEIDKV